MLLLFMAGLFIRFLVEKCVAWSVACQNSVIRSRMASYSMFVFVISNEVEHSLCGKFIDVCKI